MDINAENRKVSDSKQPHLAVPPLPPSLYYDWHISPEEEINLLDYWKVLKKHWIKIFLTSLMAAFLTFFVSSKLPKKYQAEVTFTPLTSTGGGGLSSILSQASTIPIIGGQLGSLGGDKQQAQQFINILRSRSLLVAVIRDLNLMPVLFKEQWDFSKNNWKVKDPDQLPHLEDGADFLKAKIIKVVEDKKTGLIKLQVLFVDPQLATTIANQLIVELQDFITHNSLTVANRNRQFIEMQLQKNKIDYLEFSKKLTQFYTTNQISSSQSKLDVDVGKMESLPKTFEEFRETLQNLDKKKNENEEQWKSVYQDRVVKNVPAQVYLQYLTLQRELIGRTNALLMQQYEMAKIEEAKEDLAFQVIDKAIVPRSPSLPNIRFNAMVAFTGALFLSIFLAFFVEYIQKMKEKQKTVLK